MHYNKTRHKTCKELLNEVHILSPEFEVGKGARTDLTCVPQNTGGRARDKIATHEVLIFRIVFSFPLSRFDFQMLCS